MRSKTYYIIQDALGLRAQGWHAEQDNVIARVRVKIRNDLRGALTPDEINLELCKAALHAYHQGKQHTRW